MEVFYDSEIFNGVEYPVLELVWPEELGYGSPLRVSKQSLWEVLEIPYNNGDEEANRIDNSICFYFPDDYIDSKPSWEDLTEKLAEELGVKEGYEALMNDEAAKYVTEELINMLNCCILEEDGVEPFMGWCQNGEVFENRELGKKMVKRCMDIVEAISPKIEEITYNILNADKKKLLI